MTSVLEATPAGAKSCKNYAQGKCRLGSACRRRHVDHAEQSMSVSPTVNAVVESEPRGGIAEPSTSGKSEDANPRKRPRTRPSRQEQPNLIQRSPGKVVSPLSSGPAPAVQLPATPVVTISSSQRNHGTCRARKAGRCTKDHKCELNHDTRREGHVRREGENKRATRVTAMQEPERLRQEEEQHRGEQHCIEEQAERLGQQDACQEAIRRVAAARAEARRHVEEHAGAARLAREAEEQRLQEERRRTEEQAARLRKQEACQEAIRRVAAARAEARRHVQEQNGLAHEAEEQRRSEERYRRGLEERLENERMVRIAAAREAERLQQEEERRRREEEAELRLEGLRQEILRQEAVALVEARRQAQEQERLAREVRQREQEAAQEAERRERMAELAREEMARTLQSVVSGSIITFGAGLEVCNVITGFESCTVKVKGLPLDAREDEVIALFTQQGIATTRFQLLRMRRAGDYQEAEVVIDAESAEAIAAGLDGIEFRSETLSFEVGAHNASNGMHATKGQDANVLVISWRTPSARFILHFDNMDTCRAKVRELDGRMLFGRRVKAEMNTVPPGRVISSYRPNSVKLSNLPVDASIYEVERLTGSSNARGLDANSVACNTEAAVSTLRSEIAHLRDVSLRNLQFAPGFPRADGIVEVRATFNSWDEARQAYDHLEGHQYWFLGSAAPWLRLHDPLGYIVTISSDQYAAQRSQWTSLIASISDKTACRLVAQEQGNIVRIRLGGSVKQSVGALKVRVESLLSGEPVEGWHRSLGFSKNHFLKRVPEQTGAYLRADWRRQFLKVYGTPQAVERARAMVKTELERLSAAEHTVMLKMQSVSFFVRRGLTALKEIVGEDNIQFVAASRKITVTGGEEARHALARLIDESRSDVHPLSDPSSTEGTCPICYDTIASPLELGCGHIYCVACMRHFLTSAVDSDQFPLVCMGDETHCRSPIPLVTIQRFLPPAPFNRLLEVVYNAHLARHPQTFKYCKTPDCTQIYRAADANRAKALQCPSCFSSVCAACHEEPHEGMTCAESRVHRDPTEQERLNEEWIAQQGGRVRKCPSCGVPIEKNEGCNHMECRCGNHICWRCMRVFDAGDAVYEHMRAEHGGYFDEDPIPDLQVNYVEQEELLHQALRQARRPNAFDRLGGGDLDAALQAQQEAHRRRRLEQQQQAQEEARRAMAWARQEQERRREEEARRATALQREREERDQWQRYERLRTQREQEERQQREQEERQQQQGWCLLM